MVVSPAVIQNRTRMSVEYPAMPMFINAKMIVVIWATVVILLMMLGLIL